jgi:hypothetical protein
LSGQRTTAEFNFGQIPEKPFERAQAGWLITKLQIKGFAAWPFDPGDFLSVQSVIARGEASFVKGKR